MNFSLTFSSIAVITSLAFLVEYGLATGGPVVMVWGWLVVSLFTLFIGASMAEICSVYPAAGSVYYWAGALAHRDTAPMWAYITGWFNLIGNIACDSSYAYGTAQVLAAVVSLLTNDGVQWNEWQMAIIACGVLVLWMIKNRARLDRQGWFNNFSAIYQVVTTVLIVIALLAFSRNVSTHEFVWTKFNNDTGFDSVVYVCMIGTLMPMFGISGYESGATMAEETSHATKSAPMGMINAIITSIAVGFIFILGLLYACGNNIVIS